MIADDEARRILDRAAQIQAERGRQDRTALPETGSHEVQDGSQGLSLEILQEAGAEVGLQREDLLIAAAEQKAPGYKAHSEKLLRKAELALGSNVRVIRLAFRMKCPASTAPGLIRRTAESKSYAMTMESIFGDDMIRDGVMVFRTTGYESIEANLGTNPFVTRMLTLDINRILITVRPPAGEADNECDVVIVAPMDHSLALNYKVSLGLAAGFSAVVLVAGGLLFPFPALAAWAGAAGASGLGLWGSRALYRISYRRAVKKGREALQGFVAAIQTAAHTG